MGTDNNIKVCKFGGSSIANRACVEKIKRIVGDERERKVVVVSAPAGVTDSLIGLHEGEGSKKAVIERYKENYPGEDLSEASRDLERRLEEGALDQLKAFGEETNARLLARDAGWTYVDPSELFLVSNDFGNAKILPQSERGVRERLRGIGGVVVVPGFYGFTEGEKIATFSRGGSDLSGAFIAAAIRARVYENFTDSGILNANPEIIPEAKEVEELTYEEIRELSYNGFSIMHAEAVKPIATREIPTHIRSFGKYPHQGTRITKERIAGEDEELIGVAYENGFCSFMVDSIGIKDEIGILNEITGVFREEGISISYTPEGVDDVAVVLKDNQIAGGEKISDIEKKLSERVEKSMVGSGLGVGEVEVEFRDGIGCLAVVGKGLRESPITESKILETLASEGINTENFGHGAKKRSIIYGVDKVYGEKAVRAIYDKFLA